MTQGLGGRAPMASAYRARRDDRGDLRKHLFMGGAIAAALLLVGMTGWAVMGRRPATVPVIEADSRPIRIKPENPGGMQVTGADEQDGAEKMAPAPEVPAPQALRAQMQQNAAPAAMPPAASPTVASPPALAALAPPAPLPPDSQIKPVVLRAAPPTPTPPPPVAAAQPASPQHTAGVAQVQLAAVESEAAAQAEWQRLARKMPDLLGDRRPAFQKADRDGKTFWRVRTGGFTDVAEATGFCAKMRAKGAGCTIASF